MNKIKDIILLLVSIIFYVYIMFISEINLGTGKKELENIILLMIPCFIFLVKSFKISNINEKKRYLYYYLIIYLVIMISFTFSNFRMSYKTLGDINFVREYNLVPFNSIKTLLNTPLGLKVGLYNIVGNLLMLTPLAILLPLLNDKYYKNSYFIIRIILISLCIEILQYITNCGSFDIDDIILNSSGALIIYFIFKIDKIHRLVYKLFYKIIIKKKVINYIEIFLYIILDFIYIIYILNIHQIYVDNKIDYSNLICNDNSKTYITRLGEYDYYSECKYSGYILKGTTQKLTLEDYLKLDKSDETLDKLKISKEEWIKDIKIDYNDNLLKKIYEDKYSRVYLLGIDKIEILSDNINYVIDDSLPDNFNYYMLVDLIKTSSNYAIYEGKYYNVIGCGKTLSLEADNYIISKNYKYDSNFCKNIN